MKMSFRKIAGMASAIAAASVVSAGAIGISGVPVMAATATTITQAKAKSVALSHAKVTAKQISNYDIELEKKKNVVYYDIEFDANGYEYDYEINAKNATVIKFEKKAIKKKTATKTTAKTTTKTAAVTYIGTTKAKTIALNHAKLKASALKGLKVKLEKEKGVYIYDVEFKSGKYEYEYDINAVTGKIIKYDKERD